MIKTLELKNFRKHKDTIFSYGPGLVLEQGVNESGKTTTVEAICYALYGASTLRDSFDETVTWGEAPSSLKVSLTLDVDGIDYTFTRSKAGATVTRAGDVFVTGQREVSAFSAQLLGADAKLAAQLMLANQKDMEGALAQGPAAAAALVENLADFDFFDTLVERMQARLVLGSDVGVRARLAGAEARLAEIPERGPDIEYLQAGLEARLEEERAAGSAVADATAIEQQAQLAQGEAKRRERALEQAKHNVTEAIADLEMHRKQHEQCSSAAAPVDTSRIPELEQAIAQAGAHEHRRAAFAALAALPYPDMAWEGDAESLAAEISRVRVELAGAGTAYTEAAAQTAKLEGQASHLEEQIQRHDHCHACGQLLQNHADIALKNATLQAQIQDLEAEIVQARDAARDLRAHQHSTAEELQALEAVQASGRAFVDLRLAYPGMFEADTNFVPVKLSWKGEAPGASGVDVAALQAEVKAIKAAADQAQRQAAKAEALAASIIEDEARVATMQRQLAECEPLQDAEQLQVAHEQALARLSTLRERLAYARGEQLKARERLAQANQDEAVRVAAREQAQEIVAGCHKELEEVGRNNALLRKVRTMRPLVADKLWNAVLASVSLFFTSIRGEPSTVTKDSDGFKVNGQSVRSLSGSTVDALALALRVALVKTFVPHATFLVLDEPAAACDAQRTQSMLAFIQSAGFDQTILISHEAESAAIADNIIAL